MILEECSTEPEEGEGCIGHECACLSGHNVAIPREFVRGENYQATAKHVYILGGLIDIGVCFANRDTALFVSGLLSPKLKLFAVVRVSPTVDVLEFSGRYEGELARIMNVLLFW